MYIIFLGWSELNRGFSFLIVVSNPRKKSGFDFFETRDMLRNISLGTSQVKVVQKENETKGHAWKSLATSSFKKLMTLG